ncbi:MAG: tRNA pseudouridine(55) synthase TruB [Turicibacter sp.]|nr:tRNA pseudouridine(55) synthase TruB [Turicibacter sp.]
MTGVINLYKEKGFTSHDCVAIIRNAIRKKIGVKVKVGHTGTLDPQAEGVLPICFGSATKQAATITAQNKSYRAELILGITTDTGDDTGKILAQHPVSVTENEIISAIHSFIGGYNQVPPMYSAIKIGGKKLYELARAGITVEREPRFVEIFNIELLEIGKDRILIQVDCGKGTYIRTLCEDIGAKLGCGGTMGSLVRTANGEFTVETAIKIDEVKEQIRLGKLEGLADFSQ